MKRASWIKGIAFGLTAACCGAMAGTLAHMYEHSESTNNTLDNHQYQEATAECLQGLYAYGVSHLLYVDADGSYAPSMAQREQLSDFIEEETLDKLSVYDSFDYRVQYGDQVFTNVKESERFENREALITVQGKQVEYYYHEDNEALNAAGKLNLDVRAEYQPGTGEYLFYTPGHTVSYQTPPKWDAAPVTYHRLTILEDEGTRLQEYDGLIAVEDQPNRYRLDPEMEGTSDTESLLLYYLHDALLEQAWIQLEGDQAYLYSGAAEPLQQQLLGTLRKDETYPKVDQTREDVDTTGLKITVAPKAAFLAACSDSYQEAHRSMVTSGALLLVFGLAAFAALIAYLVAGRREVAKAADWHISGMDRFPMEILLGLIFGCGFCMVAFAAEIDEFHIFCHQLLPEKWGFYLGCGLVAAGLTALMISPLPSILRRFQARKLLATTAVVQLPLRGIRYLHAALKLPKQPMIRRMWLRDLLRIALMGAVSFFAVVAMLSQSEELLLFFLLVWCGALAYVLIGHNRDLHEMSALCAHIAQLQAGDFSAVPVAQNAFLEEPMQQLNQISDTVQKTVTKTIQAERMKLDLVTNVSHDLKTPLTSVISYIDLLSKEELPPAARDYVQILEQKSERLRQIVTDVFDLAKATSQADIHSESLDAVVLLNQVLADLEDRIRESGKTVRTQLDCKSFPIRAEGAKLYRVLQNLLDNALRYSLDGTRVYVTLRTGNARMLLSVTNTSAYEMQFTADEIVERFARGDASRSTEGNGLGLSIAKSFTEACGGQFFVELDGDSFKVTLSFPMDPDPQPTDSQNA